jgi:hypothetical protein
VPTTSKCPPRRARWVPAVGLVLVTALFAGCSSTSSPQSGSTTTSTSVPKQQPNAATFAASWLESQFDSSGNLPSAAGAAGIDNLPAAMIALVASHSGTAQQKAGLSYLESHFESFVELSSKSGGKTTTVDAPGRLAEVILAAVALGGDPTHFGGSASEDDLLARLLSTETASGPDKGLFGSPNAPTYSSAFTQGFAVLALVAAGHPNAAAADWLVRQQCAGGGWTAYRPSTATPCPPPDPKTYAGPDTNSTSLAVQALEAMKVPMTYDPYGFFEHSQYPSGGFSYYGTVSKSQVVDPDSTALVIQALIALGKTVTPAEDHGLTGFQLACSASTSERGAFTYPGTKGPSLLATVQAIPAAAGLALPIRPGETGTAIPLADCAAAYRVPAVRGVVGVRAGTGTSGPHCPTLPIAKADQTIVPVVVDFGTSSDRAVSVSCMPVADGATGSDVLAARATALRAAAPVYAISGLLCSIDGYPVSGCGVRNGSDYAYWAYFHGGSRWTYASNGPAENVVRPGDVEGWRFEPDGTASPTDPPPRAASSVAALELASVVRQSAGSGGAGGTGGGNGPSASEVVLLVLGALLAAAGLTYAFVQSRRRAGGAGVTG